jgi:integrase
MFYRVAVADGRISTDPTVMLRKPKVWYDDDRLGGLSRHDLEKLILAAQAASPQRAALVVMMGVLGLRVSEACAVQVEDFAGYERGHRVLRVVGKGGKPATIPLPPLVFRVLDAAAAGRTTGNLLTTRTGRRPSRHDAFRWLDTLGKRAGLGHIHPHQLRHAAVTAALDAGATYRDVQTFGRWSSPRMIERYDRNRHNLDRHASYLVAAHLSSIASALDAA